MQLVQNKVFRRLFGAFRSFTLIELIVSILVVSIGLVVLFGIVLGTIRTRETIEKNSEREVSVLFVINELRKEIESLIACPKCRFILEEQGFFGRPFDRLMFVTYYGGDVREIEYFFEMEESGDGVAGNTCRMIKRVNKNLNIEHGGYSLQILDGIKEFNVRVFADGMWHERWSGVGMIPKFLEISLVFKYGQGERELRFFVEPKSEEILGGVGTIIKPPTIQK